MKRIVFYNTPKKRDRTLHIETDLGIINIRIGLEDSEGRRVESIEIIPNEAAGEPKVIVDGAYHSRLIELK